MAGRLVGELPLSECARRNGVATGALDVGLDPSGALAAAGAGAGEVTPLPPAPVIAAPSAPDARTVSAPAAVTEPRPGDVGPCWRYAGGAWRRLADMTLTACVNALWADQCERPGGASYGRWGERTLRRAPGRIEMSMDNRSFRPLADQPPASCVIGPLPPAAGEP